MHPVISRARVDPAQSDDGYTVSAEFYDILQARQDETRVRDLYGGDVAGARLGVLDIGAGTGRVTMMSLAESAVHVHAVEPARAMRAPLMTRLSALPAARLARVTVHPRTLAEADLRGVADVAVCHNMIACLAPADRRALWPTVARALVPGGSLLLDLPPARLPRKEIVRSYPERRVGAHVYGGRLIMAADGSRIRARFEYWVRERQRVLREHTETFWMWPASRAELTGSLAEYGFAPLPGRDDPAVLTMTLTAR
ncbi:class I SAM-dependent methyltransferase [Streptomyces sp. NPDC127072]|uniref:class I SAM-dependent methyltransferase n=1 Tax=Streptomyces sp. NPDC127072 TaxID=3347129 RepID=UPI003663069D